MDCAKRNAGAVAAALPEDPIVEILSRAPAKSVCRFKCVSKAWRDLIADPHHRKKLPQPMLGLFYATMETSEADITQIDHFNFNFIGLMTAAPVPPDIDPCFSFLTELPGIQVLDFMDSCNGLVLFANRRRSEYDILGYIVCNPTTKQWLPVPVCSTPQTPGMTHLAFDPAASSHFHLVLFEVSEYGEEFTSVHAYSSEIGTWSPSQIDEHKEQGQSEGWHHRVRPYRKCRGCAFVNGILHFIVWDWDQNNQLIVAVDVQGKTRKMIALPEKADEVSRFICYFGQSQESLHYMTQEKLDVCENKLSIWVLQDYDTQEWVLKGTLTSPELYGGKCREGGTSNFQVVDIHQDCNVVFFTQVLSNKLIAYDMGHKEASVIATFEKVNGVTGFARYVPYFLESPALTNKHRKHVL